MWHRFCSGMGRRWRGPQAPFDASCARLTPLGERREEHGHGSAVICVACARSRPSVKEADMNDNSRHDAHRKLGTAVAAGASVAATSPKASWWGQASPCPRVPRLGFDGLRGLAEPLRPGHAAAARAVRTDGDLERRCRARTDCRRQRPPVRHDRRSRGRGPAQPSGPPPAAGLAAASRTSTPSHGTPTRSPRAGSGRSTG